MDVDAGATNTVKSQKWRSHLQITNMLLGQKIYIVPSRLVYHVEPDKGKKNLPARTEGVDPDKYPPFKDKLVVLLSHCEFWRQL